MATLTAIYGGVLVLFVITMGVLEWRADRKVKGR